jgi:hypothetical protein
VTDNEVRVPHLYGTILLYFQHTAGEFGAGIHFVKAVLRQLLQCISQGICILRHPPKSAKWRTLGTLLRRKQVKKTGG